MLTVLLFVILAIVFLGAAGKRLLSRLKSLREGARLPLGPRQSTSSSPYNPLLDNNSSGAQSTESTNSQQQEQFGRRLIFSPFEQPPQSMINSRPLPIRHLSDESRNSAYEFLNNIGHSTTMEQALSQSPITPSPSTELTYYTTRTYL